jgi:carbon-monoxide dehydrogenase medium subunit
MLPPFRILNPTNLSEAIRELGYHGDAAKIYAGGAELVLLIRRRMIEVEYLLNIKQILGLKDIVLDGHKLSIGAVVTHHQLETNSLVREYFPMFADAESQIANIRVRNQGTVGGNICFSDPHSDPGTALLVYEATVTVGSIAGEYRILLDEFFRGMYTTALKPDEILTRIEIPALPVGWRSAFLRVHHLQRPTVNVAAGVKIDGGKIGGARLAVGCVGPRPMRLSELEGRLPGLTVSDAKRVIAEARRYLFEELKPVDDLLGSKEYKIHVTGVLLGRALEAAVQSRGDNLYGCRFTRVSDATNG